MDTNTNPATNPNKETTMDINQAEQYCYQMGITHKPTTSELVAAVLHDDYIDSGVEFNEIVNDLEVDFNWDCLTFDELLALALAEYGNLG